MFQSAILYSRFVNLHDKLFEFVTDSDREQLIAKLQETEDCLYEDGEDETKGVYVPKLDELKKPFGCIGMSCTPLGRKCRAAERIAERKEFEDQQDKGMYQEGWHSATQVDDQNWSEGNVQSNIPSPTQMVNSFDDVQTPGLRRSTRQFKLLVKLHDYVLSSNVKYGIEKCKWIWKIKYKACGKVERYKAILVAKGFSQRESFDYDETFSSVVKMVTVRCLISIDVCNSWPFYQLDVNNAFLYVDLKEDVYMSLLEGYDSSNKNKVCKHGFEQSLFDYSLYVKKKGSMFVALLVLIFKAALRVLRYLKGSLSLGLQTGINVLRLESEGVARDKHKKVQGKQVVGWHISLRGDVEVLVVFSSTKVKGAKDVKF
ncbi:ribonuclease H-like domain-containing protein [Tanacetum coccineum]